MTAVGYPTLDTTGDEHCRGASWDLRTSSDTEYSYCTFKDREIRFTEIVTTYRVLRLPRVTISSTGDPTAL